MLTDVVDATGPWTVKREIKDSSTRIRIPHLTLYAVRPFNSQREVAYDPRTR